MGFAFQCVKCKQVIRIPNSKIGKLIMCPHCQESLTAPLPGRHETEPTALLNKKSDQPGVGEDGVEQTK